MCLFDDVKSLRLILNSTQSAESFKRENRDEIDKKNNNNNKIFLILRSYVFIYKKKTGKNRKTYCRQILQLIGKNIFMAIINIGHFHDVIQLIKRPYEYMI